MMIISSRDIKIKKVLDFEIGFPYVNDDGTFSFDKEMSEFLLFNKKSKKLFLSYKDGV